MEPVLKAVYNILVNDADVSAITTAIYPVIAPENTSFPFVTMRVEGTTPHDTKTGASTVDYYYVDVDCFDTDDGTASGYSTVVDLAKKIRAALDRATPGTYNTIAIDGIQFLDGDQGFDKQSDVYIVTMNYKVRVNR